MKILEILENEEIEIPKIQRDYVQGLDEKKAINFLNAIKKAMDNKEELNLDFIYGSKKDNKFVPIDGQQRLTTLFLLTYYLSLENSYIEELKNFSYEIRPTSKDFFKSLTDKKNWEKLKKSDLVKNIKNSNWYFLSWENDLTIKSSLKILDLIENKFQKNDLIDLENISFKFLDLDTFSLNEDLYIKMNARGKQLSKFENFKAEFEKYINDETMKAKLDNEWLDVFWNFKDYDKIDNYYYNFFFNVTFNFYAENLERIDRKKYNIERNFLKEKELFDFYEEVYQNRENINRVIKLLDNIQNYKNLKEFCGIKSEAKYYNRVYFYVWSLGISKNFDEINMQRWQRIAKNLVKNTRIEDIDTFINIIQELLKLSNTIKKDVYDGITFENIGVFNKSQIDEEKLKIELIKKDNNWENKFIETEKHWYLDGQIGFLIKYSNQNLEKFIEYKDKFFILFNDKIKDDKEKQTLIHRALLTIEDYLVSHDQRRYTFCSFDTRLRIKYENWRKIFNAEFSNYFKELLDKINNFDDLKNIINNYNFNVNDWKSYFINPNEEWNVIKDAKNYQIVFEDEKTIFLNSGNTQPDKWGWRNAKELYSWYIFKKIFKLKQKDKREFRWRIEADVNKKEYGVIYYQIDGFGKDTRKNIGIAIEKNNKKYILVKKEDENSLLLKLEKSDDNFEIIKEFAIEDILKQQMEFIEELKKL
jgi:hypothetical protein